MASLAAYLGQIENHIMAGRRGQPNKTFSLRQIADEFVDECNAVMIYRNDQKNSGASVDWDACAMTFKSIAIQKKDWVEIPESFRQMYKHLPKPPEHIAWHYCKLPNLLSVPTELSVRYIGPIGMPDGWDVTTDLQKLAYEATRRVARQNPLVYIDGNDTWFTGRDGRLPNAIRAKLVCNDPREAFEMGLSDEPHPLRQDDMTVKLASWPITSDIARTAVKRIVNNYLETHNRPVPSNDGNAPI